MFDFDVFLSYAHEDHDYSRQMARWLRQRGYAVWVDEERLIPGTRFRAALQQGIRESQHMVIVLTDAYVGRPWTQREIDLFDLDVEHSERRLLSIQLGELTRDPLDQAILIHQRIPWKGRSFDPEAFWLLDCGIAGRPPGPREHWSACGTKILTAHPSAREAPQEQPQSGPTEIAQRVLTAANSDWKEPFGEMRHAMKRASREEQVRNWIRDPWAQGHSEIAAVAALAVLAEGGIPSSEYLAWPFVDLSCLEIADWILIQRAVAVTEPSEIWFSWAVARQHWGLLPLAAAKAPNGLADHFNYLALASESRGRSFDDVELEYDYGVMITPWNNFHLSWLANHRGDFGASMKRAAMLCSPIYGDARAARFLNRMATWPIFARNRQDINFGNVLSKARARLGLPMTATIPSVQMRLHEIWESIT
jgi:hypothetical protein